MGPIPAVGTGGSSPLYSTQRPSMNQVGLGGANGPSAANGLSRSSAPDSSRAIAELFSAVSQLLTETGNLDTDKTLQLLIALMILMAILGDSTSPQAPMSSALAPLGNSTGGMQFLSYSESSTTISIQQSSTTVVWAGAGSLSSPAGAEAQPPGSTVDIEV